MERFGTNAPGLRGYNTESLTVVATHDEDESRLSLVGRAAHVRYDQRAAPLSWAQRSGKCFWANWKTAVVAEAAACAQRTVAGTLRESVSVHEQ